MLLEKYPPAEVMKCGRKLQIQGMPANAFYKEKVKEGLKGWLHQLKSSVTQLSSPPAANTTTPT
eukprot:118315-Pyramimonas_sp.AAC.1